MVKLFSCTPQTPLSTECLNFTSSAVPNESNYVVKLSLSQGLAMNTQEGKNPGMKNPGIKN
eukprot:3140715-Amphidinium_carterae.1